MMTIYSGGLIVKDPDSERVLRFNWADRLGDDVGIADSEFAVTGPDDELTIDNASISGQYAPFRLLGGTLGKTYTVRNRIVTNETPTQTLDASFKVLIQQK